MAPVTEYLPSKYAALVQIPVPPKKEKRGLAVWLKCYSICLTNAKT
jgi:hypothetical protein